VGNALPLKNIPSAHGAQCRASPGQRRADGSLGGASAQLVAKEGDYALLKLPPGRRAGPGGVHGDVGQVGNTDHENVSIGKAGRNRWKGSAPAIVGIDEPGGSSARRRRRQDLGRPSSGHPVGQPTRGTRRATTSGPTRLSSAAPKSNAVIRSSEGMARSTKKVRLSTAPDVKIRDDEPDE